MYGEACEVEDNTVRSWPGVKLPGSLDSCGDDALHRAREQRRCTPGVKASFSGPHRGYASCAPFTPAQSLETGLSTHQEQGIGARQPQPAAEAG